MDTLNNIYSVQKIIGRKRTKDGSFLYKIKWKNWPVSTATWEPLKHLKFVMSLVKQYDVYCSQKNKARMRKYYQAKSSQKQKIQNNQENVSNQAQKKGGKRIRKQQRIKKTKVKKIIKQKKRRNKGAVKKVQSKEKQKQIKATKSKIFKSSIPDINQVLTKDKDQIKKTTNQDIQSEGKEKAKIKAIKIKSKQRIKIKLKNSKLKRQKVKRQEIKDNKSKKLSQSLKSIQQALKKKRKKIRKEKKRQKQDINKKIQENAKQQKLKKTKKQEQRIIKPRRKYKKREQKKLDKRNSTQVKKQQQKRQRKRPKKIKQKNQLESSSLPGILSKQMKQLSSKEIEEKQIKMADISSYIHNVNFSTQVVSNENIRLSQIKRNNEQRFQIQNQQKVKKQQQEPQSQQQKSNKFPQSYKQSLIFRYIAQKNMEAQQNVNNLSHNSQQIDDQEHPSYQVMQEQSSYRMPVYMPLPLSSELNRHNDFEQDSQSMDMEEHKDGKAEEPWRYQQDRSQESYPAYTNNNNKRDKKSREKETKLRKKPQVKQKRSRKSTLLSHLISPTYASPPMPTNGYELRKNYRQGQQRKKSYRNIFLYQRSKQIGKYPKQIIMQEPGFSRSLSESKIRGTRGWQGRNQEQEDRQMNSRQRYSFRDRKLNMKPELQQYQKDIEQSCSQCQEKLSLKQQFQLQNQDNNQLQYNFVYLTKPRSQTAELKQLNQNNYRRTQSHQVPVQKSLGIQMTNQFDQKCVVELKQIKKFYGNWLKNYFQEFI